MQEVNIEMFGKDVMEKVGMVGGLDDECELLGGYRPTGQPGVSRPDIRVTILAHVRRSYGSAPEISPCRAPCRSSWYVVTLLHCNALGPAVFADTVVAQALHIKAIQIGIHKRAA